MRLVVIEAVAGKVCPGVGEIVVANRHAEDMYGYLPGELIGQPVESLVPDGLQAARISQRAEYAQHPTARPRQSTSNS